MAAVGKEISGERIRRAWVAGAGVVRHTPVLSSRGLTERCGGTIALKAENLQRTGSFKLRGALAKIDALGPDCAAGVVCGSAGNHAQGVAYAAREKGVPCEVFMPELSSIAKGEAVRARGATLHLVGDSVEEAVAAARTRAREAGMAFIHPFDDPDVIAGQGGVGIELLLDVHDLAKVVVPLGGGGLTSGIAVAIRAERPDVEIVGVQAAACAPYVAMLRGEPPPDLEGALTIADGIAVKQPGAITGALLAEHLSGVTAVAEDDIAEAMIWLLERAKLVVEGAGAVGVAALLSGAVEPAPVGTTVAVLSGGNVDAGVLAAIARRHETLAGRRLVVFTRVPDRPGALATLLGCVADVGANLLDVEHVREGVDLHVRETAVQLVLETRGGAHAEAVVEAMRSAGYAARVVR